MTLLMGKGAPEFTANAVMPDGSVNSEFSLAEYISGSKCVLFFYPMDFFPVCTSDIIAFNNKFAEFEKRNTKIVGVSVDSYLSHKMLRKTVERLTGGDNLSFPLISDAGSTISKTYDVLINGAVSIGATFIIGDDGIVRYQMFNDLPIGRNVNEILRQIDALIHHWEKGNLCDSGWQPGSDGIANDDEYGNKFFARNAKSL